MIWLLELLFVLVVVVGTLAFVRWDKDDDDKGCKP